MQSKRDQVQAHMFLMGRLTTSMLRSDPDAPESPQGRTNRGVAMGVLFAVLLSAGAFVFGMLSPGGTDSWRTSNALVVDQDTGSRYLYLDGRLRPVRNYTSARLLVGAKLATTTVHTSSLAGVPRGAPVGIPGAPDTIPPADRLDSGPWQICSGGASVSSRGRPGTTVAVGTAADGAGLGPQEALLIRAPDASQFLVWHGSRLRLDVGHGAAESLGYETATPLAVTDAFLNSLPLGPDLAPPEVPGEGSPGPRLDDRPTTVGQVVRVAAPGSATRYYLVRRDGLTPMTATEAALALGSPDSADSKKVVDIGASALAGHLAPQTHEGTLPLPSSPPRLQQPGKNQTACVRVQPSDQGPRLRVSLLELDALGPVAQPPLEGMTPACFPADRIMVPAGRGMLVHALGAGGGQVGDTVYLVTDTGMKYRVPTAQALESLGYSASHPAALPSTLLSLLPTGPDLAPTAAAAGKAVTTAQRCAPLPEPGHTKSA
ncbi:type VII secretion protein EccB [Streptomyces sp. NPDC006654]|uniref:type VII secretion protein EccB n=1 Tax=Streptomyces sp. NPDC006654 TaxID=3156897 RepID=UPI0033EA1574